MNLYTYNSEKFPLKIKRIKIIKRINKNKSDKNHEEFMKAMIKLSGSVNDPTFVEPQEIKYESQRDTII